MEEMNNIPTDEVVPNTTEAQPTETVADNSVDVSQQEEPSREVRQQNWDNGRRRIDDRKSAKARIRELEARLAQYEGKDDDYSRFQAQSLQDRIDDMTAMNADAEANAFANHAAQFFGDETDEFMQNVYRYSRYVNNNEPSLLKYCNRDYGPILLHEWMQRMDNPQLRQQWLQMTEFEKGRVLDNFYTQIGQIITQAQQPRQRQNVPVPNGGRQSPSSEPSDDFGIELGRALNRHK